MYLPIANNKLVHILYLPIRLHTTYLIQQCCKQIRKKPTSHPPAYSAQIVDNFKHVSHFESFRLSQSPAANLYTNLPLSLPTLRLLSQCSHQTHKKSRRHPPAHIAHTANSTRQDSHLKFFRLSQRSATNLYIHLLLHLHGLRLSSPGSHQSFEKLSRHHPDCNAQNTNSIKHVRQLKSFRPSPSPTTNLYTYCSLRLCSLSDASHSHRRTHKQPASRHRVHESRTTKCVKHASHFKSVRLPQLPSANLCTYFPPLLYTLNPASHCPERARKQPISRPLLTMHTP